MSTRSINKKVLSVFLSVTMLFVAFYMLSFNNAFSVYGSNTKSVSSSNDISINLDLKETINENKIVLIDNKSAVVIDDESSVSWDVDVPQTGKYNIVLEYFLIDDNEQDSTIHLLVNDNIYKDHLSITMKRIWKDVGGMRKDALGNELYPLQEEVREWKSETLSDFSSYYSGPIDIDLEKGKQKITLKGEVGSLAISSVNLESIKVLPTYAQVNKEYKNNNYVEVSNYYEKYQAELPYQKSNSVLTPTYDRGGVAIEENSPSKIYYNTIGQTKWSDAGDWISYKVNVKQSGLYKIVIRARQNFQTGMSVMRDISIDGEIPFEEFKSVLFPYSSSWKIITLSDGDDVPYLVYLEEGEHEIRFTATINKWSDILGKLDEVNKELNMLYRQIVMVTGVTPDSRRDYKLDVEIPGIVETFEKNSKKLDELANEFDSVNIGESSQSAIIRTNAKQLKSFVKDPDSIPSRLNNFQTNNNALSDWLLSVKSQPIEFDYFMVAANDVQPPKENAPFYKTIVFKIKEFFASFTNDYNVIGQSGGPMESIDVWFSGSRDQAQIIRDMISVDFTPKTDINVNISLVYQGFIEASLAGIGPDVALDVERSLPVNLSSRGELIELSQFKNYSQVIKRFTDDATLPYTFEKGVFGLPSTQAFYMMFYRTDIFEELEITPPDTWDDLYDIIPILQRENYNIGFPYGDITDQSVVKAGLGSKDLFTTLLLQKGGQLYNQSYTASQLDTPASMEAFQMWTEFYTKYSFPLVINLPMRMRTGNIPIGIARFDTYNVLSATAPEIRGLWKMVAIPGMKQSDGTVKRTVAGSGTANVIFKKAKDPEVCWEFLDWWTSDDVQYEYGISLEKLLGPAARYTTANLAAFNKLPWEKSDLQSLNIQREQLAEIPEVPGGYSITRSLDNAFRSVIYRGKNTRERFTQEFPIIDNEIKRKRIELGLNDGKS